MNSAFSLYGQYICIAMGIYCIVRGIITLTTGRLTSGEEAKLREFSDNGARKYKMLSAGSNLFGGVLAIAIAGLKIFGLIEGTMFKVAVLAIIAVLAVVYVLIRNSCKKMG